MNRKFAVVYLSFLAVGAAWLLFVDPDFRVGAILFVLMSLGMWGLLAVGNYWWPIWQRKADDRKLRRLLGTRTLEEVLAASEYEYGWYQTGDEGYRIWPKGDPDWAHHIGDLWCEIDAQIWIVKQFNESNGSTVLSASRECE